MKKILISVAPCRTTKKWKEKEFESWDDFFKLMENPTKSNLDFSVYEDYKKLGKEGKEKRGAAKDGPCFVAGKLVDGRRGKGTIAYRNLIALDADKLADMKQLESVIGKLKLFLHLKSCVYTTPSHSEAAPRCRILLPLARNVSAQEYEFVSRKIADKISKLDSKNCIFDMTSFQPERLMYFPKVFKGGKFLYKRLDGKLLNPDIFEEEYKDEEWKNPNNWPGLSPEEKKIKQHFGEIKKSPAQSSNGWVRAFCSKYNIMTAIESFLPDVYDISSDGKVQLKSGSREDGVLVFPYEDENTSIPNQFLVSFHDSDKTKGLEVNAFDLVRLWKYGDLDSDKDKDLPVTRKPSFMAMVKLITEKLPEVHEKASELGAEEFKKAEEEFTAVYGKNDEKDGPVAEKRLQRAPIGVPKNGDDWKRLTTKNAKTGNLKNSILNVSLILLNDRYLAGRLGMDIFSEVRMCHRPLPWDSDREERDSVWDENGTDLANLRAYLEQYYNITNRAIVDDAISIAMAANQYNAVADWLYSLKWDKTPRVETLLTDFFGVEDDDMGYTRAVCRKTMIAAIRRAKLGRHDTYKFDNVPVLIGGQGIGKSEFCKRLLQTHPEWETDQMEALDGKNKDNLLVLRGVLVAELGEMDALKKADVESSKKIISAVADRYRDPYAKTASVHPRRCVFIGTGNVVQFLNDSTGNRRFWPVYIPKDWKEKRKKNLWKDFDAYYSEQVWAEAVALEATGERTDMDTPELIRASQEESEASNEDSPLKAPILEFLSRKIPEDWNDIRDGEPVWPLQRRRIFWEDHTEYEGKLVDREYVNASEILLEAFPEKFHSEIDISRRDTREVAAIVNALPNWERKKQTMRYGCYQVAKVLQKTHKIKNMH